jgi:hypothetical protein
MPGRTNESFAAVKHPSDLAWSAVHDCAVLCGDCLYRHTSVHSLCQYGGHLATWRSPRRSFIMRMKMP